MQAPGRQEGDTTCRPTRATSPGSLRVCPPYGRVASVARLPRSVLDVGLGCLPMDFGCVPLPDALVYEIVSTLIASDSPDPAGRWAEWECVHRNIDRALAREPCMCGACEVSIHGHGFAPLTKAGPGLCMQPCCRKRNADEFEARVKACVGERPDLAIRKRLLDACSWDAVCHGARVANTQWWSLLLEGYDRGPRRGTLALCALRLTIQLTRLTAKQVLCRAQQPVSLQQVVDIHCAINLDDDASFIGVARASPRLLLDPIDTYHQGRHLGLPACQRAMLCTDPRVECYIKWEENERPSSMTSSLRSVLEAAEPREITRLLVPNTQYCIAASSMYPL